MRTTLTRFNIMDFRSPERMTDTDEGILEEPYRPFYNVFGSKPVLVKQYGKSYLGIYTRLTKR
jgi:hypothetical protein